MRLALWQGNSPAADLTRAVAEAEAALTAAAALGADALVLPEVWLPGYNQPDIAARALTLDSPPMRSLAAAAKAQKTALVVGYAERDGERIFNSAVCFGPDGALLGNYRKIQLYGPREKAIYQPGDAYMTFDLGGEKIALLICYDVEFAPHVKALTDQGVTVILNPTANMVPFDYVTRHTVPSQAVNHAVTIVYANFCGVEGDLTYLGGSLIVGPHGEILAQAGEAPCLLVAEIPPRDPKHFTTQAADLRVIE